MDNAPFSWQLVNVGARLLVFHPTSTELDYANTVLDARKIRIDAIIH